jgi:hypothetical protein
MFWLLLLQQWKKWQPVGQIKVPYSSVLRHIWDQGTAGLPKTTDYWKKWNQWFLDSSHRLLLARKDIILMSRRMGWQFLPLPCCTRYYRTPWRCTSIMLAVIYIYLFDSTIAKLSTFLPLQELFYLVLCSICLKFHPNYVIRLSITGFVDCVHFSEF